jgi:hypothetical protein
LVTNYQSNRKLMDTTSWYHIVLRVDTTQASAGDRIRLYINGVQETSWASSTTLGQNVDTGVFKSGTATLIGARHSSSSQNFWDGYMAHMHIVDGTSYAPTTFGETDSTTGEWKAILTPSVTYGTNGAFLKFENSSALGTDSSGNGNTFAVNGNLKQSVSTASNNFCTLDAMQHKHSGKVQHAGQSLYSYANATASCNSTLMMKTGKWYVEVKSETDNTGGNTYVVGIVMNGTHALYAAYTYGGANSNVGYDTSTSSLASGITHSPNLSTPAIQAYRVATNYGTQASANDIIMMAFDINGASSKIWLGRNGTWFNAPGTSDVGNPASGTNVGLTFDSRDEYWGVNISSSTNQANDTEKYTWVNFGEGRFGTTAVASGNADGDGRGVFEYAVPSGFYAICTKGIKDRS